MIDRRSWFAGSLAVLAGAHDVRAQTAGRVFRIGLLGGSAPDSPEARHVWRAFFRTLRERGYEEGRNLHVEGRYYGDDLDRLPAFAAELVRLQVDVIVAAAPPAPEAARRATATIPVVMANHPDPVGSALAASLARPGGNVTGLSMLSPAMRAKQLQLLQEIVPGLARVAFLRHPDIPLDLQELQGTVRSLGLRASVVAARTPQEIAPAIAAAAQERAEALSVLAGSMFFAHRVPIAELALRHRLPSVYLLKEHAEAGGLLTYGIDLRDSFGRAAGYVAKILEGAKPGELPIEQPTTFEMVVNLKTARALGLSLPRAVLVRADRVIE